MDAFLRLALNLELFVFSAGVVYFKALVGHRLRTLDLLLPGGDKESGNTSRKRVWVKTEATRGLEPWG